MSVCEWWVLTEEDLRDELVGGEEFAAFDLAAVEEEVDDGDNDGGCLVRRASIVGVPLDEDEQVHVAEDREEQDQLGQEVVQQLGPVFEVDGIEAFLDDAEGHVGDGEDDGDLHLEAVQEGKLHLRAIPDWVNAHGVDAVGVYALHSLRVVAGLEEVEGQRHEVVVH